VFDGGLQIVDDDGLWHAAEMPEGIFEGAQKVVRRLPA